MARVTHVKSAQQRYKTVPVLNEDGTPKVTPVMRKDGSQRTTKRGKPVTIRVTQQDRTQPLPPLSCDFPGCQIDGGKIIPGTAYKHVTPKSGPYGGRQRNRHAAHPSWQPWDLSDSLGANIQRIQHDAQQALDSAETPDDVTPALSEAAEAIRELAEAKRESAQNMEDGFGHATEQSDTLASLADDLESWADSVEQAEVPDLPEPDEVECDYCGGTGKLEETVEADEDTDPEDECTQCGGDGTVTAEEPTDEQMEEWREQVRDAASVLDEAPA